MSAAPPPPAHGARVVVVGGGVAGLTAAWRLRRLRPDLVVEVLEGSDRVGGKLRLGEVAGVGVDVGAESMLRSRPEAVDLAAEVGLADALTAPATFAATVWTREALRPLPRSVMGVPADLDEVARSGLLSADGLARARREPDLPRLELAPDEDLSVGDLVGRRFGEEVVDRMVEPLLGGVYAGHARRLSARATVPMVTALLERDDSLTRAAAATLALRPPTASGAASTVFAGIEGGIGRLPLALADALGDVVRTGVTVRALRRTPEGFALETGAAVSPGVVHADAVVLAVPPAPASRLLADVAPTAATGLAGIEVSSMALVTLAFAPDALPDLAGSGFLVPPVDGRRIKAATFASSKWAWVDRAGGSAGVRVVRCSLGRLGEEATLQRSDDGLVADALHDLRLALGDRVGRPVDSLVTRWGGALPQYAVGHLARVARIRHAVAEVPGLAVCGAAYDGVGIPAVIASAHRAVEALAGPGTMGT